jgi:16S rRNA (uracil1498-N3)-methyltransferase
MIPRLYFPDRIHPNQGSASATELVGDELQIDGDELHYLTRVLRAKKGDRVQLFDGIGQRCEAELVSLSKQSVRLSCDPWRDGPGTQTLSIRMIQGLSSADKMDWTVEKAVELGVSIIQPVFTQRSVVRLDSVRAQSKLQHWQRLAIAACRQSGRDRLPDIKPPLNLAVWLAQLVPPAQERLLLDPPASGQPALPLSAWQPHSASGSAAKGVPLSIDLMIGPEAGFDDDERQLARACGFTAVQLGPWILRTETAGIAAVAALQVRFGTF